MTAVCFALFQEFVDNGGVPGNPKDTRDMKAQVDAMLADLKKAHRQREEQLSHAAKRYRHLAEISAPELYRHALGGTKRLITEFLDEVEASMHYMCDHEY